MKKPKHPSVHPKAQGPRPVGASQDPVHDRVAVPKRKISETILDFGEPLLSLFEEEPPIETMKQNLKIIISMWNAHVLALPTWGEPEHLASLRKRLYIQGMPLPMQEALAKLSMRRLEFFADDPRAVGRWELLPDGAHGCRFRCEARLPRGVVAEGE